MNTKWNQVQNNLGIALISTGLLWGVSLQFSVHAQQSAAAPASAASATTSGALKLDNGKLEVRQLSGSLDDAVNRWALGTRQPEWLGYSVAQVNGHGSACCGHDGRDGSRACSECQLEGQNHGVNITTHDSTSLKVKLEGPRELAILFRAESGKIGQIRVLSMECAADSGGLTVVWLEGTKASESVSLLEKFVRGAKLDSANSEKLSKDALTAIALHADAAADRALESFVAADQSIFLRRESGFWLGAARGAEGLRALQKMAQHDPSSEVREQVAFALSISPEPGALPEIIRMAREDHAPQVRGQALFWLGQKAGEKAAKAISDAIDTDPDTDVKKKAVFALSQMPPDQGVPKLILIAQTNHNPQVRKEAMFWLGQSGDPQALAFFEKVLSQ
jgi:hypothetical protein